MKKCQKCKELKPVTSFGKWARKPDGLNPRCKFCISAYKRREKQATPKWSNKEEVTNIKKDIKNLNIYYGPRTVSLGHIIPLMGVDASGKHIVSGLNIRANMEVEDYRTNVGKANRTTLTELNQIGREV